jgi:hypothetical protein
MKASVLCILYFFCTSGYAHGGGGHGGGGHGSGGGHCSSGGGFHSSSGSYCQGSSFHGGSSTSSFNISVGVSAGIRCNDPGFYGGNGFGVSVGVDWYQLGYNAQNDEHYEAAITDFTKAIEKDSTDEDSYNYRGMAYCMVGEPYKAIMDFDEVIKLNPKKASAYNNRATVFESIGMMEAAVKDYKRACALDRWSMKYRKNLKEAWGKYITG